jgi:membrane protease YdiL (CAAX protease family)
VKQLQKRDYLAWHNVLLVLFDTMFLAGCAQFLILVPLLSGVVIEGDASAIQEIFSPAFILLTILIQDAIMVWFVWHQVVRRRVIPLSEMGISSTQLGQTAKVAKWILVGVVVGLALFSMSLAIEQVQSSVGFSPPNEESVLGPESGDVAGYAMWLISGCLVAPLAEEFFFRGYAFYAFKRRHGLVVGVMVSALAFSLVHSNIYAILPILVAGIGLALAYHWSGSLVPPIIAHATNNFIALTLLYLGAYG